MNETSVRIEMLEDKSTKDFDAHVRAREKGERGEEGGGGGGARARGGVDEVGLTRCEMKGSVVKRKKIIGQNYRCYTGPLDELSCTGIPFPCTFCDRNQYADSCASPPTVALTILSAASGLSKRAYACNRYLSEEQHEHKETETCAFSCLLIVGTHPYDSKT